MVRPCRGRALRLRVRERLRGGRAGRRRIISFFEDHPAIELYYAPGPRVCGVGAQKTARINALHPVWHLNDQEALAYTGRATVEEAGAAIAEECGNAVVITAGKDGAHLFAGRKTCRWFPPSPWTWWTPSARAMRIWAR